MSTNVLTLPGNYRILAKNGYVFIQSGAETEIQSGANIIVQATTNISNIAGTNIRNKAAALIENIAGSDITNEANSNIENIAGGDILSEASGIIENIAGGNINNQSGADIENIATGSIINEGTDLTDTFSGQIESIAGGKIELISGGGSKYQSGDTWDALAQGEITLESLSNNIKFVSPDTITLDGSLIELGASSSALIDPIGKFSNDLYVNTSNTYDIGDNGSYWKKIHVGLGTLYNAANVQNPYLRPYDQNDIYGTAAQRQEGALYVTGGVGIEKDLNVGGFIYGRIETANTSLSITVTATNSSSIFYPTFALTTGNQFLFIDPTGIQNGLTYVPSTGKLSTDRLSVLSSETSVSKITGAFTVSGGIGIGRDITVGGNIKPDIANTGSIGVESLAWADAYINNLYTKFIGNTNSNITLSPGSGLSEILGDIRVKGTNPIGTYPVVTNTLYVTMDGNDTNDGRAMDPSRACRTIGGAMNSPYYQPGTQILVSAGRYLEDNPLVMKPYTSVRGSDIRTTFIEPINKTQDLFHMNSGCYLNYMNFLNGRSGRLPGQYDQKFNRGAYATAYPPQTGDNRIDLFQSPYTQNCTNQSGPWLNDGTMFLPNQTVQVPAAVGTGTWEANTSSIIVNISTGTIKIGQSINAGKQNPGFFNARTLLLANKPFIQSQVVAFVENTFNSGAFTYNQNKCRRDTGLIINAIAMDMLQESRSDSTFAGIQYWNQGTYTGDIPNEIVQTIAAIGYLKSITTPPSSPNQSTINSKFDIIINILTSGVTGVSDLITYGGLESNNSTIISDFNWIQNNKETLKNAVISWISSNFPGLVYSQSKCRRDVGYILDGVSFDLLHGGNVQSIKSGVYYYSYSETSTLAATNEIPATTAAYNFLKSIISNIVEAIPIVNPYQNVETQNVVLNRATSRETAILKGLIDNITTIVRNGPEWADEKAPINLTQSDSVGILNAYNLLMANMDFLKAEVIAFINQTMNNFTYNRQLCYRDTGILLENLVYDAVFGGNEKSIESGKAYFRGVTSIISGQETQTVSAIDHIVDLCEQILVNSPVTPLTPPTDIPNNAQVINTALTGGNIIIPSLEKLVNITTNIILNGPDSVPSLYNSQGPDAAFVSAEVLLQANRAFIQEYTIYHVNRNLCFPPKALPYNSIKCRRDTKLIVDSIANDLLFSTSTNSQSVFAGIQYFKRTGYTGAIKEQLGPTIDAVTYLRDLSIKVVQNITTATDSILGINRYTNSVQTTASNYATIREINTIRTEFGIILNILNGKTEGWSDEIIPNDGTTYVVPSIQNTVNLLRNNINYLQDEVIGRINAVNPGFTYNTSTCRRDIGYIIDSVSFDLLYGGNRQAIQAGLSYYQNSNGTTQIPGETTATIDAFNFIGSISSTLIQGQPYTALQKRVKPILDLSLGTSTNATKIVQLIGTITNIIQNSPSVAGPISPIPLTANTNTYVINSYNILLANKEFIAAETIAYLDQTYNPNSFNYDQDKCYRDTGLIIDAVSQDILLGGNQKSIEAGLSYWNQGYNSVGTQLTTTTQAINYARDIALQVIANSTVTYITGTVATQVINPFYQYGGDYMPQEAVLRNFNIITEIITEGPSAAPEIYAGGGLFSLTGLNGSAVKIAPKITAINSISPGVYRLGLDTPTVGFGGNATLYFGDTLIFPLQDKQVEAKSLEYTGSPTTWNDRKVDSKGAMGGSLVDGAVISARSPIQSMVYDAFTQLNQGGIGLKITNNGYAQLVSVFTIFCDVGVICDNGGIASITNSNCNFGNISLLAKGYGPRDFSGTVFNPKFRAYPFSPEGLGLPYLDQFYPDGYWPNLGGSVEIFVPDTANRPHIGQVLEIEPPDGHINEQGFPGFLNTFPSTSTLTTGTITLSGVSTDDVFIGNSVYIRDQFGRQYDDNGIWYASTGTVVKDVEFNAITFNKALTSGGGDPTNPTYFTIYFCGNSYYTVQTSYVAPNPYNTNTNILSANLNPYFQGPAISQINAHVQSLIHLNSCTNSIIANVSIIPSAGNTSSQVVNSSIVGGASAETFINLRFGYMIDIINAANISTALNVVPQSQITEEGTIPTGAGSAVTLIQSNLDFLAQEVAAYVDINFAGGLGNYDRTKCIRDIKLILRQIVYDLQSGGNYHSVYSGLSYWSRPGSYHIVTLGEAVTRPDLFPDGSIANFYQRSYISASGYLFEYVGAGANYGALPQRGVADPIQIQEVVQLNAGKVFYTSTDQNGDFRIGPGLVISQATGVLSGRTFVQSLYANMTPFILAIE